MIKIDRKLFTNYFCRSYKELLVIFAVLALDLLSKLWVGKTMVENGKPKTIIPNFFNIYYVKNYDAAFNFDFFGLGDKLGESGMRTFFICFVAFSTLIFVAIMVYGYKNHFVYRLSLALIIGGALGNLYDRIFHHGVRDFLDFVFFGNHFPTFNLADSFLIIGACVMLLYFILFFSKDEKRRAEIKKAKKAATTLETSQIEAAIADADIIAENTADTTEGDS